MADNNEQRLQVDSSPAALTKQSGVRRVNNLPVVIVAAMLAVFLISMVLVAMDRNQHQDQAFKVREEKAESSQVFAKEIAGNHADGIIQPRGMAGGTTATSPNSASTYQPEAMNGQYLDDGTDLPLIPPRGSGYPPLPNPSSIAEEESNHIRQLKLQQLDEAAKAKTAINTPQPSQRGATTDGTQQGTAAQLAAVQHQLASLPTDDATASYQSGLAVLRGNPMAGSGMDPELRPSARDHTGMAQFEQTGTADRWKLDHQPQPPRSAYELRAGFVVPATLISGINSELPGQIMGQVAQNVFDTATGKYLLLPQGARLVGTYSSNVTYGQARLLIAWQRIIFPDGKALDIGAMPGADSAGYTGFNDQVNNHYLRIFGSAFLMSGVVAGVTLSQPPQNLNAPPTVSSAMSQALGQELGDVAAQMIGKNMNIAPTLDIRPGYRFNVIVTKDLTFTKPYQSFDY